MAGRPRKFDRNEAVDRFVQVFWDKGFAQTSVDDLQASTGIQRGSFYAAFTDKDTAFLEALDRYTEQFTRQGLDILQAPECPKTALANYILFVADFLSLRPGRGCLLLSTICEPPSLISTKKEGLNRRADAVLTPLAQACQEAEKGRGKNAAKILYAYVLAQILGLNALARSGESKSLCAVARMAAELIKKEAQ